MAKTERERARSAGSKIGDSIEDAWLHTKITGKLMTDSDVPTVNVDVENKVVTLRGSVKSASEKMEAERLRERLRASKKSATCSRFGPERVP